MIEPAKLPEYLYHYTSVESLALILSNQTIRFTALDKLDDPQECSTADATNICSCFFVSCWTDDAKESIPMWNMYASVDAGVRIKLPTEPFKKMWVKFDNDEGFAWESFENMAAAGFISPNLGLPGPSLLAHKVYYSDAPERLCPRAFLRAPEGSITQSPLLNTEMIGTQKATAWEFQHEWRYIFNAYKFGTPTAAFRSTELSHLIENNPEERYFVAPFDHYDLALDPQAFSQMELMLSPKISPGHRTIVEALVKQFNPVATIAKSVLQLR